MTELGISLQGISTALTAEDGMELLKKLMSKKQKKAPYGRQIAR